jgi:molecular chaperone GrpE (heat shock protein)
MEAPAPDPRLDKVLEKVGILEQLFVKRIRDDAVHAAAYTSLHTEMAKYRDDAFRQSTKPLLKGIVLLYDAMNRSLESLPEGEAKKAVELHVEELVELLHRQDVELMSDAPPKFDPRIQTALSTEPAASPEEDQRVARVVRKGFRWGTVVLRSQEVVIKVFKGKG